jgi:hypothetical protein
MWLGLICIGKLGELGGLQNELGVFFTVMSVNFANFSYKKTENSYFSPVLPNESASKTVINFNVMVNKGHL